MLRIKRRLVKAGALSFNDYYLASPVPVSLVLTFVRVESAILSEELRASGVIGEALLLVLVPVLTSIEESLELVELALVRPPQDAVNRPSPNIIAMHFIVFIKILFL